MDRDGHQQFLLTLMEFIIKKVLHQDLAYGIIRFAEKNGSNLCRGSCKIWGLWS